MEKKRKKQGKTSSTSTQAKNKRRTLSKQQEFEAVYKSMMKKLDIPARFQNKTFDNYNPYEENQKIYNKIKKYAENFDEHYENGDWLVMSGGYGLGKTHLALAVARKAIKTFAKEYLKKNPHSLNYMGDSKILFISSSNMIQSFRDSYDNDDINEEEFRERYKKTPLLIIDDLGTEKADNDWLQEKMYMILDYRYRQLKPTVITTNLDKGGLIKQVSLRVVERMVEASADGKYLFKFKGKSYRRK